MRISDWSSDVCSSERLARLTAASARRFIETWLWPQIDKLRLTSSGLAGDALTQFARSAFANKRALVWPAQAAGIAKLRDNSSFVLCTPTGSGKTTVATLGAVQGLFAAPPVRSEEHTSELQSLMRISYAVFCLKKKNKANNK